MNETELFYGLDSGDEVNVHGEGFGRIIEIHRADHPENDWVEVEIRTDRLLKCGHVHECVRRLHAHPRSVSLTYSERKRKGND
jgi:hypothetical protein